MRNEAGTEEEKISRPGNGETERKNPGVNQPDICTPGRREPPGPDIEEPDTANPYRIYFDNSMETSACTECTGLIYRAASDREEWNTYRNICDFIPVPNENK
ncbi:MAG: hypothetical protein LUF78_00620 [Clostridiales bacterium]|nr:hypothetical protein [Clostridiales bacterium]MCD8153199.1 hypothetical protein [Clostridiales bacterium]